MELMEQIERKIIEVASKYACVDATEISPDTKLVDDLGFDSIDVVEFSMTIEDKFDVCIPDSDVDRLATVRLATEYVAANAVT